LLFSSVIQAEDMKPFPSAPFMAIFKSSLNWDIHITYFFSVISLSGWWECYGLPSLHFLWPYINSPLPSTITSAQKMELVGVLPWNTGIFVWVCTDLSDTNWAVFNYVMFKESLLVSIDSSVKTVQQVTKGPASLSQSYYEQDCQP
jgi:hypothetical protein